MGTEVLYPQDWLAQRLRPAPAAFLPRRKLHKAFTNPNHYFNSNLNPSVSSSHHATAYPNPRPCRKAEQKKRREGSPKPPAPAAAPAAAPAQTKSLVMGQVTILKRGESLDEKTSRSLSKEKKGSRAADGVLSSDGCGDLIVFGTGRIGPEPAMVPKQIRIGDLKPSAADSYAGSAFSTSPAPSALPLPTFPMKKAETMPVVAAPAEGFVDLSATKDLRRLLRLG